MKKVLFVGTAFPPAKAGSVVVMVELLKQLPVDSYKIIGIASDGKSSDHVLESRMLRIGSRMESIRKIWLILRLINVFLLFPKAKRFARGFNPDIVISPYPSLDFLLLGALLARGLRIPFLPYLHDTVVEAVGQSANSCFFRMVQKYVFKVASRILVMSEGMADFYKVKYGIDAIPIEHIYNEPIMNIPPTKSERQMDAFWAGAIYGINDQAIKRVFNAARDAGINFTFTSRMRQSDLKRMGINGNLVQIVNLPTRADYLNCLKRRGLAVLALNGTDESTTGADELATIFPTKTPEYLAAGLPILVHCPTNYFLARFFKKHNCGIVVSSRDEKDIQLAIRKLLSNTPEVVAIQENALKAARIFAAKTVMPKFMSAIERSLKNETLICR